MTGAVNSRNQSVGLRLLASARAAACRRRSSRCMRVHPRVCGEARRRRRSMSTRRGPSPRVLGSHCRPPPNMDREGSIPACAGKPLARAARRRTFQVHPRVCGEALVINTTPGQLTGPSPRVRGSLAIRQGHVVDAGSIPACAGKPFAGSRRAMVLRVHPRVCGEAPS